jgi:3-hydroxyisobutyrate dehydrogenase-like beta-hydroxyacid dehydrogenase
LDTLISSANARLVTCPVIGRPAVAEKAQLLILMSGDYRSKKEVAYYLVPAVGRKVVDLGGNLEKAPTFKLIANSIILGSMEVIAESMTLAEKSGIGSESVHNLIKDLFPAEMSVSQPMPLTTSHAH